MPDSIKLLSQKYDAEDKAAAGVGGPAQASPATSPPLAATPSVTIAAAVAAAAATSLPPTPCTAPSTSSPATVAATPHDQLPGYLTRNAVYESPEAAAQTGGVAAPAAAATTATPTTVATKATQQLTPNTAIAQLLGPVLRATIEEIEGGRAAAPAAARAEPAATSALVAAAVAAAGSAASASTDDAPLLRSSVSPLSGAVHLTPGFPMRPCTHLSHEEGEAETPGLGGGDSADIDLAEAAAGGLGATSNDSPASFGGFALPEASTPELTMADGVPRDAEGVPKLTPATVTVRRGRSATPPAIAASGDLAADLFGGGAFGSPTKEELRAQEEAAAARHGNAATVAPAAAAAAPVSTPGVDFSFFPASLPAQPHQQVEAGAAEAAGQADTPELRGGSAAPSDATPVPPGPSPEILGFFESQQVAAVAAAAAQLQQQGNVTPPAAATAKPQLEPAAEPLLATAAAAAAAPQPTPAPSPLLPRSIVKTGRPVNEDGTPVLGRAQRLTPGAPEAGSAEPAAAAAPPTITKELRLLMAGLSLEDREGLAACGSLPTLSPVRATGAARRAAAAAGEAPTLGASHAAKLAKVITPVRRSARVRGQHRPLEAMLEETQYSYGEARQLWQPGGGMQWGWQCALCIVQERHRSDEGRSRQAG